MLRTREKSGARVDHKSVRQDAWLIVWARVLAVGFGALSGMALPNHIPRSALTHQFGVLRCDAAMTKTLHRGAWCCGGVALQRGKLGQQI